MDDLLSSELRHLITHQKVVLSILEHHVDRLVFQYDLPQCNEVTMMQLPIELRSASSPSPHPP